jgi:hypothetical protein
VRPADVPEQTERYGNRLDGFHGSPQRIHVSVAQFALHSRCTRKILRKREPSPEASGASHTQEVRLLVPRPTHISGETRTRGAGRYSLRSADASGLPSAEFSHRTVCMQQVRREERAFA